MPKGMTKYQLEHFKSKVRRNFGPLIQEQELLVKQYRAEATEKIVGKLAKKMGADKILNEFRKAEAQLKAIQDKARTFFKKKAEQSEDKKKEFNSYRFDRDEKLSLKDCKEQITDWAMVATATVYSAGAPSLLHQRLLALHTSHSTQGRCALTAPIRLL